MKKDETYLLISAYERLHVDFRYLEEKIAILTREKNNLDEENQKLKSIVLKQKMDIWRMQLENEKIRKDLSNYDCNC